MNTTTNKVIGVVAAIALILGVVAYNKTPKTIVGSAGSPGAVGAQGIKGDKGDQGERGFTGPQGPAGHSASPVLGSVAGPDIPSPYLQWGGVRSWQYKTAMIAAASTTCSIQAPVATSTLIFATANFTQIASTTGFDIGYSANSAFATTTILTTKTITTATQDTVVASTTGALGSLTPPYTLAPNSFINFKIGGGSVAGTLPPVGFCTAGFREVQ